MRRCVSSICIAAGLAAGTGAAGPEFEVASVKPAAPWNRPEQMYQMRGGPGTPSPGQFTCTHISLKPLLLTAYDLKPYQIDGPPAINSDKYDIVAKVPEGTTREQFRLMIQNLLAERLGLVVHREMRELPVYELVVAKGGLKMKEPEKAPAGAPTQPEPSADGRTAIPPMTKNKDGLPEFQPGMPVLFATSGGTPPDRFSWVTARMKSIADLLNMLEYQIDRPVSDKTGLTGLYDFNLRYADSAAGTGGAGSAASTEPPSAGLGGASDPEPTLMEAFEKQLGLKLQPTKGPVEVLVVDRVNRTPTEN